MSYYYENLKGVSIHPLLPCTMVPGGGTSEKKMTEHTNNV